MAIQKTTTEITRGAGRLLNSFPRRGVELKRPCECGCDFRDGVNKAGYLYFSNGNEFVSIWLDEVQYNTVRKALQQSAFDTADGGQAVTFNRLED